MIKKLFFVATVILFATMTSFILIKDFKHTAHAEQIKKIQLHDIKLKALPTEKENLEQLFKKNEETNKPKSKNTNVPKKKQSKEQLTVKATAYTADCHGCSGITKTGINLKANPNQKVIAVDPDVIPLGSIVYVEGYGTAVAGDIGSAINGHRIDVFIPSEKEALQWGVKEVNVTILS
jgi:3D (Asp-Asp-Asp) domain-containing protein